MISGLLLKYPQNTHSRLNGDDMTMRERCTNGALKMGIFMTAKKGNTKVTITTAHGSVETDTETLNKAANGVKRINSVAAGQLRSIVERIERMEEEKKNMCCDIRDVYGEAKANGYDTKAIREIVKLRKMDNHERDEHAYTLDLYKRALGMQGTLDLEGGE